MVYRGGRTTITGDISSQFRPLADGCPYAQTRRDHLSTDLNSKPYVDITIAMKDFGVELV